MKEFKVWVKAESLEDVANALDREYGLTIQDYEITEIETD